MKPNDGPSESTQANGEVRHMVPACIVSQHRHSLVNHPPSGNSISISEGANMRFLDGGWFTSQESDESADAKIKLSLSDLGLGPLNP